MISPGMMSPSSVPLVTSIGSDLAIIFWYFISQNESFEDAVFPQWNPMNVSLSVYCGYLGAMSLANISAGTELLMSRSVTASLETIVPINSLNAP